MHFNKFPVENEPFHFIAIKHVITIAILNDRNNENVFENSKHTFRTSFPQHLVQK